MPTHSGNLSRDFNHRNNLTCLKITCLKTNDFRNDFREIRYSREVDTINLTLP